MRLFRRWRDKRILAEYREQRMWDKIGRLEDGICLLNERSNCFLQYVDACMEAHELAFHAPKTPKKEKK